MKKIIFVADYFQEEVLGGAELSTEVLINNLKSRGFEVEKLKCIDFKNSHLNENLIITNFVTLSDYYKNLISENSNYIIIERDQKYVRTRNLTNYDNFIAPDSEIVNKEFYKKASSVLCLTEKHTELTKLNLKLDNIFNIGCTQFSEDQLLMIESNITNEKNGKFAVVNGKLDKHAVEYCKQNNLDYDHLPRMAYSELMKTLSKYEGLLFMSHHFESFCRLLVEAKILGLRIITDNRSGCTYESWFKSNSGLDMSNIIREKVKESIDIVERKVEELFSPKRNKIINEINRTKLLEYGNLLLENEDILSDGDVAVVGNSGNMLLDNYGSDINKKSCVIRFNDAQTKGYEDNVGTKTTIRIMNCHYLLAINNENYYRNQKSRFPDFDRYFVYNLSNEIIIFKTDPSWKLHNNLDIINKIESKNNKVYFISEDFYNLSKKYNREKEASNGMIGLMLAYNISSKVHTYGFSFYNDNHKRHYYADYEDQHSKVNHNWNTEKEFFNTLDNKI